MWHQNSTNSFRFIILQFFATRQLDLMSLRIFVPSFLGGRLLVAGEGARTGGGGATGPAS